ncbi:hypothetical protein NPIL_655921, partial [Nephila pilipes]
EQVVFVDSFLRKTEVSTLLRRFKYHFWEQSIKILSAKSKFLWFKEKLRTPVK